MRENRLENPEQAGGSMEDREGNFRETGGFRPGHKIRPIRGNRRTPAEVEAFSDARKLAPGTAGKLRELLEAPETPAMTKVKICSLILDYTYGKPEESLKIKTDYQAVSHPRGAVFALIHRMMNQMEED